jgi:hypothetical protein
MFNASAGDMRLAPAVESPLLQREGLVEEQGVFREYKKLMDSGSVVPTNKQWQVLMGTTLIGAFAYDAQLFLGERYRSALEVRFRLKIAQVASKR